MSVDKNDVDAPTTAFQQPAYADQDFAAAPQAQPAEPVAVPVGSTPVTAENVGPYPEPARRGTIDLGILLVRIGLALWLILASVGTFFQLGGNGGMGELEAEFAGYAAPGALALAVPTMQLAAGLFLLFGLITPLFAAVAIVVTGFGVLHALTVTGAGLNVFGWDAAVGLSVMLLIISVALQFTGPGLYSLDFGRSWARRPLASSWIFLAVALVALALLWWFGAGVNPLA